MNSMPALLELKSVTKVFGAVRALVGVSFELRAGEVHALLGENGAGKSTLIKVITGAHTPDDGDVMVGGRRTDRWNPAAAHASGIACIYQQPALFPDLSVSENIALGFEPSGAFRRVRWQERRHRAVRLLARIGADIDPDREVKELSMPEQQLVEIARALGAGARVLILDEPTASLTAREVDLLLGVIRDLRARGVGIVYITHRLEEIFQIADRVTVLRDGSSVGTRPAGELTEEALIRMMVGRAVERVNGPVNAALGEVRLKVEGLGCATLGVHDVSFEIRAGEIFALAGLVGAGRTELARVLFGLTPAESGRIWLDGQETRIRSPREAIAQGLAYVPEDRHRHGIIQEMTVAENLTMAAHERLFPWTWLRFDREFEYAREQCEALRIRAPGLEAQSRQLSGGNQQKVALGRWLGLRPRVLLLDEPTQGVDIGAKDEVHGIIRRLATDGLAVLLISSEMPEVLGLSHRVGVMRGGRLTAILASDSADAHRVMTLALGPARTGGNDGSNRRWTKPAGSGTNRERERDEAG